MFLVQCDIAGCKYTATARMTPVGPEPPRGWAVLAWAQQTRPQPSPAEAAAQQFVAELGKDVPPEARGLFAGLADNMLPQARLLSCKAFVCPACFDARLPIADFHVVDDAGASPAEAPDVSAVPEPPQPYFHIPGTIPPIEP